MLLLVGLEQMIRTVTLVRMKRLHQRVAEHVDVPGNFPDAPGKDDGGVEPDDVVAPLNHELPPLALDVLFERRTERPVVPRGTGPPVDLARLKDEPSTLGEIDNGIERGGVGHEELQISAALDARSQGKAQS